MSRVGAPVRAVVIGGGLAGVSAATILAERGVQVVLVERAPVLGGRVAGWNDRLKSGEEFQMERGFHAFFRQYYNLRALLRRIDPTLSSLAPVADYPILGPGGAAERFAGLPIMPPFNVMALLARTKSLRFRDILRASPRPGLEMLAFDRERTYALYDSTTAREYLDSLKLPQEARRMLFHVFAHSFFNPEAGMSAAELLMMFHFYFMGNREGLLFDVLTEPFSVSLWKPFQRYLERLSVTFLLGEAASSIESTEAREGTSGKPAGQRWTVRLESGRALPADAVVLATTARAAQTIVHASPDLKDAGFRRSIDALSVTLPFAVLRLWLDRRLSPERPAFAGTAGVGILDNISLFHLFEGESRSWAAQHAGAVVELHAYALPETRDEASIREELIRGLHEIYPEAQEAAIVEERYLHHRDCPSFGPGSDARRPPVETPWPTFALAGDYVRLPSPTALMERATTSGFLAANRLLGHFHVRGEDVWSVPRRGLLARLFG